MSDRAPGKIIYIGSIPYDQTEEQVLDIAKSVGPVVNLKMIFDKETGKSKGYAFVEYPDVETASSAVRNLNNYSIGHRQLKCDFSWESSMSAVGPPTGKGGRSEDSLPPLPPGRALNPGEQYPQAVSSALSQLDDARRHQVIQDAIAMAKRNPVLMEELLSQCPQLTFALVEALLTTGKADEKAIQNILLANPQTAAAVGDSEQQQQQPQQTAEAEVTLSAEERAMIKQVVDLPDDVVATLPEADKAQVLEIKQNYANGAYGAL